MRLENVRKMSSAEVKCMLNDCAWREVNKLRAEELTDRPKLCVLKELVGRGFKARCVYTAVSQFYLASVDCIGCTYSLQNFHAMPQAHMTTYS